MPDAIALITQDGPDAEEVWSAALAAALPDEAIVPFRQLSEAQRREATVAIVANPAPADVAALPALRWVQSLWAGVERLVAELGPAAPPVVRLVDPAMARVMAEAVLAWTYYLQRDMPFYAASQRGRRWEPRPYRKPEAVTVGLLGLGKLGLAAAARLREAGFPVVGWSRAAKADLGFPALSGEEGLLTVLARADILVCLVPLTAATRGLLDAGRLGAAKPGAALINFARGPLIATGDLLAALDAGHLSHAVLDVFDAEPLPPASPLWAHPGVTVLPHVSGPTDRGTAAAIVAANVRAFRDTGEPPRGIDFELGY